jgi:CubicO group peptidase (beta-lactamase class C family)
MKGFFKIKIPVGRYRRLPNMLCEWTQMEKYFFIPNDRSCRDEMTTNNRPTVNTHQTCRLLFSQDSDAGKSGICLAEELLMKRSACYLVCLLMIVVSSGWLSDLAAQTPANSKGCAAEVLQPFVEKRWLAGVVAVVANRNKVLSLETIGYADLAAHKPMKGDTLFWIASESKPMTATAVMMLVDEGKIQLDDPVEKYLPEFKEQWLAVERDQEHVLLKRPSHPVTIRHLLSHTSGLPFKTPMEEPTLDRLMLQDAARNYAMAPLEFEPGSNFQYANAGFNTAGRLIEVVTGMPYEEFMRKRLFSPLGMRDTTFWPTREQLKRLAKSYKPNEGKTQLEEISVTQLQYPLENRQRRPMPAGGLFSTAPDVVRFCQMILNGGIFEGHRYVSEDAVTEMTRRQTPATLTRSYGLGWDLSDRAFGHGGAYSNDMSVDPKTGLITVFLVQHAGFLGDAGKSNSLFKQAAKARFASRGN